MLRASTLVDAFSICPKLPKILISFINWHIASIFRFWAVFWFFWVSPQNYLLIFYFIVSVVLRRGIGHRVSDIYIRFPSDNSLTHWWNSEARLIKFTRRFNIQLCFHYLIIVRQLFIIYYSYVSATLLCVVIWCSGILSKGIDIISVRIDFKNLHLMNFFQ